MTDDMVSASTTHPSQNGATVMTSTISRRGRSPAGDPPGYRTPYTVTASSSLSEDHFLVKPGKFDPSKDKVATYVHDDDGALEAMVIQGGVLSQLYHDAARGGAWALAPVKVGATDIDGVIDVAAGRPLDSANKVGALHVFCRTATTVLHLVQSSDRSWTSTDLHWPATSGNQPLRITESPDGGMFVYWFAYIAAKDMADLYYCLVDRGPNGETARTGTIAELAPFLEAGPDPKNWTSAVARLSRPDGPDGNLQLWAYTATNIIVRIYRVDLDENLKSTGKTDISPPSESALQRLGGGAEFKAVFAVDETKPPYAIAEGKAGQLWTLVYNPETTQATKPWQCTPVWSKPRDMYLDQAFAGVRGLPQSESSDPAARADKMLDLYVLLGTSLWLMRQYPTGSAEADSTDPVFGPAVGLQGKVATVSLPSTRGSGTGMMFLDTDGELQTLTQDPVSGAWTGNPVHLPATEPLELTTFRTQLSVADAWGQPVIGATVQLTAAEPTLAMINGAPASLGPASAVPAVSNITGQIVVAVPATGLAAPALTISGANLAKPVTVHPSGPVNEYLTGTASLNYLPPLTPEVLSAAPLGASELTPDRAKSYVDQITNAAKAAIPSALRTAEQRIIRSSYRATPGLYPSPPLQVGNLEFSIGDFTHEVVHAIKTGAATVAHVVTNAAATVAHWAVDITVTCGDFTNHVLTVTVTDLKAAADVVHSVAASIGSTVGAFLDWLKAQIMSLLHDTVALATQYEKWIRTAAADYLPPKIRAAKNNAATWLNGKETAINHALDQTKERLTGKTLSDLGKPPAMVTAAPPALAAGTSPLIPDVSGAHASWLLDKIQADLGGVGTIAPISGLDALLGDLSKDLAAALANFEEAARDIWKTISTALTRPQDIATTGAALLIDALKDVVDAAIALARAAVDTLCDAALLTLQAFGSILDTSLDSLPLLGPLLKAAGLDAPSLGQLVTLMIAFPTVLAYKIAHGSHAAPFQASPGAPGPGQQVLRSVKDDLTFAAAGTLGFWAFADAISATLSLAPDEVLPDPAQAHSVTIWGVIDTITPFVVGALTIPTEGDALPFTATPDMGPEFFSWTSGLAPGLLSGMLMCFSEANPGRKAAENSVLVLTAGAGAFGIFCGLLAAVEAKPLWSVTQYGALILCNLPAVGAIALTEPQDAFAVGLQIANCVICGGLGAIATAFAS